MDITHRFFSLRRVLYRETLRRRNQKNSDGFKTHRYFFGCFCQLSATAGRRATAAYAVVVLFKVVVVNTFLFL